VFRQEPFAEAARRDGHAIGWNQVIDHLAAYVVLER
jgi:hypothetical protein